MRLFYGDSGLVQEPHLWEGRICHII